ncbi:hypothetical protein KP509_13G069400 [Ceratopteris richardii]|uniref:Phosphoadenosine phosphosulphate reductase domain-containing protein n=1 Tax=Ceratopteris richardii TaxID=49495 RepID=A0A8T2TIT6_CERRI|nr:hypothetical protein KP509_13G069400 [Ceratopteris richardii]KAH7421656.1 hypothetical protein KP509_13G069400 [Ceratopteris richardii]
MFSSSTGHTPMALTSCLNKQLSYSFPTSSGFCREFGANSTVLVPLKTDNNHPWNAISPKEWFSCRDLQPKHRITVNVTASNQVIAQVEDLSRKAREQRLQHLEEQALFVLKEIVNSYQSPAFPCALIAGDVVILDLLSKLDFLKNERVKVIFIDTFHLFPETYSFLNLVEKRYGFKAHVFHAAGVKDKNEFKEKYGSDLFITDIDEYDRICKVEPFSRSLDTLKVDAMINGRRRDHGAERAHLEVVEGDARLKVQPLAYWEFRDVWEYLQKNGIPYHPLHDEGYPSIGDVQSTLPVPKDQWFEYGGERSGRFQGLKNKDGSSKTECGIHVSGS